MFGATPGISFCTSKRATDALPSGYFHVDQTVNKGTSGEGHRAPYPAHGTNTAGTRPNRQYRQI